MNLILSDNTFSTIRTLYSSNRLLVSIINKY